MGSSVCEMIGIACIVAFMMSLSSKAPYQLRMAVFMLGSGLIVFVCIPFFIFRPRDYRNALVPAYMSRQLCRAMGIKMEVKGIENVRKEHGSVVLINHQSILDLLVLAYLWPVIGRATVVAKKEILYLPFFGVGSWLWGTLFIDRARKSDSISALQKESKAINERNCKLLLFPEGTRNSNKESLLPFKKGSFHIALQSQCAIQPVVVSKYWFLNDEKKMFRHGRAIIKILPEIETKGRSKEDIDVLIRECYDIMQAQYTSLSQETKLLNTL